MKKHGAQYTVRDVPDVVDARLREEAAKEQISLNQAALKVMERGLGLADGPVRRRSLRGLVKATDSLDRAGWEKALRSMDQVNPTDWT
jgi:hypothetical protein